MFAGRILAAASLMLLSLSACAESSAGPSTTEIDTGAVERAREFVENAMAPRTPEETALPTDGPPAVPGKKVVAITCSASVEGCRAISNGHVEAAEALGWDVTLIDGKGSAQGWNDAMETAIASRPDVIALGAIPPTAVEGAIERARAAGVLVVCTTCGVTEESADLVDIATGDDVNAVIGEALGNYIVANSQGNANVLMWYYPEFAVSKDRFDAVKAVVEACASCQTETFEVKLSEWGTTLPGRIQSLLSQHPDVNWLYSPADETAIDGMNAVLASGLSDVRVAGGNGNIQALETIADGEIYVATAATSYAYSSWAAMDNANRLLSGEAAVEVKAAVRVIDKTNVDQIPEGEYYGGDVDFRSAYEEIWQG